MKLYNAILIIVFISISLTSCKSEKEVKSKKIINEYIQYIDSINQEDLDKVAKNWASIETNYNIKKSLSDEALKNIKHSKKTMKKLQKKEQQFNILIDTIKTKLIHQAKVELIQSLFSEPAAEHLDFNWVNKKNILSVYKKFINTIYAYKTNYSKSQWNDIKQIYDSLNKRKQVVAKEELSTTDNIAISRLSRNFEPLYKLYSKTKIIRRVK